MTTSSCHQERKSPASLDAVAGLFLWVSPIAFSCAYLTTDWKSGEVRRLANWLSEEE